jgi:hypothetical protein
MTDRTQITPEMRDPSPAVLLRRAALQIGDLDPERVSGSVTEGFAVPTLATVRRSIEKLRKIEAAILADHPDAVEETPKQALLG